MKPGKYSPRESGENLLIGVELLEAWRFRDQPRLAALLLRLDPADAHSTVIAVCRAAEYALTFVTNEAQTTAALRSARNYAETRRDTPGPADNDRNTK